MISVNYLLYLMWMTPSPTLRIFRVFRTNLSGDPDWTSHYDPLNGFKTWRRGQ